MMTPTEQDKELREAILLEFKNVHRLAPADYTENCTNVVMSIINTQKRLYAESVIGDDEAVAECSYLPPTLDEMTKSAHEKAVRNQLRAEQRARIIQ